MNGEVFLFTRSIGYKRGDRVLEMGSLDVNGSVRENFPEADYTGTDLRPGNGVDLVCPAEELPSKFPAGHFDIVLCLETLEHCEKWRDVLSAGWCLLKVSGRMCVTTPTKKKGYHGYPHDYWRWELEDYRHIFQNQRIVKEADNGARGIGVIVEKIDDTLWMDFEPYRVPMPDKFK